MHYDTAPTTHNFDQHNHHEGHASHNEPIISQRWKWATVLGNAAIGTAELATGNLSTLAVAGDGVHNVGDMATYYMQAEGALKPTMDVEKQQRMRKISHWIIATTSLGLSAKAGIDLGLGHEDAAHSATLYAAGASLALNGVLLTRLQRGIRNKTTEQSVHERDLSKHFWKVDIPSASLAVVGASLQKYNVAIEQVAAVASGLIGAYAFRPTKANLGHNCLGHLFGETDGHEHHDHDHVHHPSRMRQALGRTVSALAFSAVTRFGLRNTERQPTVKPVSYQHAGATA
jgi:hypothetical protein